MVQWLELSTFTPESPGSTLGGRIKIPQATKKKKSKELFRKKSRAFFFHPNNEGLAPEHPHTHSCRSKNREFSFIKGEGHLYYR